MQVGGSGINKMRFLQRRNCEESLGGYNTYFTVCSVISLLLELEGHIGTYISLRAMLALAQFLFDKTQNRLVMGLQPK